MKWDKLVDCIAAAAGTAVGFLYGEVTGLFWAMIAFMAVDYVTGVPVATHYQLNERRYRANPLNPLAIRI